MRAIGLADSRGTIDKEVGAGKTQLFVILPDFVQIETEREFFCIFRLADEKCAQPLLNLTGGDQVGCGFHDGYSFALNQFHNIAKVDRANLFLPIADMLLDVFFYVLGGVLRGT